MEHNGKDRLKGKDGRGKAGIGLGLQRTGKERLKGAERQRCGEIGICMARTEPDWTAWARPKG